MSSQRLLRVKQIIGTKNLPGLLPISRASWWAGVKAGKFPQPVKLGERTTCWRESDIALLVNGGESDDK
jgi:prophage regulatory protein